MAKLQLGVIVGLKEEPAESMEDVRRFQLPTCQVSSWNLDLCRPAIAIRLRDAAQAAGIAISTFWGGVPGRRVWDFLEGPTTIGLVPPANRRAGVDALKRWSDFAADVGGIPSITTHVGFLPVNPSDSDYLGTVAALRDVAAHCQQNGQQFWFETGQETPITLLRTIEDVGAENLGINLDPANLLMYGMANPLDALDVFGSYVRGLHAKDGDYPTNGRKLGVEKPLGEGRVGFPALIAKLRTLGFDGAVTIEREISGPRQAEDIRRAIELLTPLL
jgi:L-ribulose-5-phosphate 3-epimerase